MLRNISSFVQYIKYCFNTRKCKKKEMLGRVFANLNILSTISTTIGITVFGIIGNTISVDILLILVGAFIAILSIWIWKIYRENKSVAQKHFEPSCPEVFFCYEIN